MLVSQPALGNMGRPWPHPKTGSRINPGTSVGAKAKLLFFNRTQSSAVTGLPTGHNTQQTSSPAGLLDSLLCRMCGVKEKTSTHIPS